eukprot:m.79639 g.79639  ORF g.79639 m.79639 type:complete len:64 (+) comp8189_c1_seq1:24-215(+)
MHRYNNDNNSSRSDSNNKTTVMPEAEKAASISLQPASEACVQTQVRPWPGASGTWHMPVQDAP